MRKLFYSLFLFSICFASNQVLSQNRTINLVVSYKTVNFAEKKVRAIAVNHQIPAPTLHFKEGDHVVINVFNHLHEGTIIHWHGIILPWQMDGVEGISQPAIAPGKMFQYHFTLRQSGTYWYHAHAGFQEQQGLYGALIIDPKKPSSYHDTKDYAVVLSDWSNTNPNQIFLNLKKDGEYYSPRFPLQPSLFKFIHDYRHANSEQKKMLWQDYKMMQQMRMSIYDLSDVAYDAFLLNGKTNQHPWTAIVKVGDVVRLRLIDAGGSTNFHVKIPGHIFKIIHIDGNDVHPVDTKQFYITPGETYDVLVKITNKNPTIIYAESADTLGHAVGALITGSNQIVNDQYINPFPEPMPVTHEMMQNRHQLHHMDDMTMSMQNEPSIHGDHFQSYSSAVSKIKTAETKYSDFVATVKTNDPDKKIDAVIRMELFGYMGRYIWMINGLPEYKAKPIVIEPGKRYRIIFTNESMMHHPMHIHGHWFILRNGHGSYDPLLHTIDVAPGSTVVADVDADASGQWFFHCHHLYHMISGMSRVFQYQTIINIVNKKQKPQRIIATTHFHNRPIVRVDEEIPIIPAFIHHPMAHPMQFYSANVVDVGQDVLSNTQEFTLKNLYGSDYNKLKLSAENAEIQDGKITDLDLDIFYWRALNQFWAIEGGINYFNQPAYHPYWQPGVGLEGMMPYFIDTELRTYFYDGNVKFDVDLSRDTQITNRFFIRAGIESIFAADNVAQAPIASGLNEMRYIIRPFYRVSPGIDIYTQYQYTKDYNLLANLDKQRHDSPSEHILTLGVSLLF